MGREFLSKKFEKNDRPTPSIMRRRSNEYTFDYLEKTQSDYLDGITKSSSSRCLHHGQNEDRLQINGPIVRSSIVYLQ